MFGLGELGKLFIIGIYLVLSIPVFIFLLNVVDRIRNKTNILRISILTVLSSIPLLLFSYSQYNKHRQEILSQVGIYFITDYPNCSDCKLELSEDNSYTVTSANRQVEKGEWSYKSGSDYSIVTLSNGRQLGGGGYQYHEYKLKYSGQ